MTYSTLAQVQELMAAIGPNNAPFSASTTPKDTQVTDIMAGVAAEIDMHLTSVGYTVPVAAPAMFVTWLAQVNADGAVARVLKSAFPNSIVSQNGGPVIPAYAYYEKKYQDELKAIDDRTIVSPDAPFGGAVLAEGYLTANPDNDPFSDGTSGESAGEGQQPFFSMSKVF